MPQGPRSFLAKAHLVLENGQLPAYLRATLTEALREINDLQAKADDLKNQLESLAALIPSVQFLMTVPGIGILSAFTVPVPLSWRPNALVSPTRFRPGPFARPRLEAITSLPSRSPTVLLASHGVCGEINAPSNGVLPKRRTPSEAFL